MINQLITEIEKLSIRPMENQRKIKQILSKGKLNKQKIILFDWECPPRFIQRQKNKENISFDVNLKQIFKGQKIDQFTEIPRTLTNQLLEEKILNLFMKNGFEVEFYKFIADTNTNLVEVSNKSKTKKKFVEFKKLLSQKVVNYPVKTKVYLFSSFLKEKKLNEKYDQIFIQTLENIKNSLIDPQLLKSQIKRTKDHMGLTNEKQVKDVAEKTIASYAAEGAIFEALEANSEDYIWLNLTEIDLRTIKITNLTRQNKLPMIFVK